MKILITSANTKGINCATRLRRLKENARITLIDQSNKIKNAATLKQYYNIDIRPATAFLGRDTERAGVARLQDLLTNNSYYEEFDHIIITNNDAAPMQVAAYSFFDNDLLTLLGRNAIVTPIDQICGRQLAEGLCNINININQPLIRRYKADNMEIALVGLTEKELDMQQITYMYSILPMSNSNSNDIINSNDNSFAKLIYTSHNHGQILGFAAYGSSAMPLVDIISAIMSLNGNIHALSLSNPLGKIARNVLAGRLYMAYPDEVAQINPEKTLLLDVRPDNCHDFRDKMQNLLHIPLESLRENIFRLTYDKDIVTICNDGKTSYIASCILMGHGFNVRHLTGGLYYYNSAFKPYKEQEEDLIAEDLAEDLAEDEGLAEEETKAEEEGY